MAAAVLKRFGTGASSSLKSDATHLLLSRRGVIRMGVPAELAAPRSTTCTREARCHATPEVPARADFAPDE